MKNSSPENHAQAHSLLTRPAVTVTSKPIDNALTRTLRSCCIIPQRYVLGVMGLLGVCNAYTMRVCLNLAITQMVNNTHNHSARHGHGEEVCTGSGTNGTVNVVYKPHAIFDWNESTQGLILSGFYYGYAITQVPGGYLAERFGGKWTLGVGLLSTALFTFLTPVVTRAGGATALFILRLLQGMGEARVEHYLIRSALRRKKCGKEEGRVGERCICALHHSEAIWKGSNQTLPLLLNR
ncbi:Putative inorganic phosphate cotransporter [Eumeta japonica]|uniref:Inorganic phosphate cotransporter n=1 Tax=Eumeta variegata TaxID=151549 RepID=A0A4C1YTC6_EUMVA|nr:Putative inorganic phosphate cotransporter [Eumeta japonica]